MKRLLIGVCKQWYAFANEYLFEHIVINKSWQLEPLLRTLPRLPAGRIDPNDTRTLGWFVKRLDILVTRLEWVRIKREDEAVYSAAPQLCTLLPNLLSLNVAGAPLYHFPSGTDAISPSLKQLTWSDNVTAPALQDLKELIMFMENHPNVTAVCFPPTEILQWPPESNSTPSDWEGLCWPGLEELVFTTSTRIRVFYHAFRAGVFPSLKRLAFPYSSNETLQGVLSLCGANLTKLHLSHYSISGRPFWSSPTTLIMVRTVQQLCPQLREFRWSIKGESMPDGHWEDFGARIPGVTLLGTHWVKPMEGGYVQFCKHVLCWVRIFPDLKVVRLFGEGNVEALLSEGNLEMFSAFLEECRLKELRVEDIFERRIMPQGSTVDW